MHRALRSVVAATLLGVAAVAATGAGSPAAAAGCTGLSTLFGGCRTTTTTAPPPPPPVAPPPAPTPPPPSAPQPIAGLDLGAAARESLDLANRERVGAGLPPLEMRDDVAAVAAAHSARMAASGSIFHNSDLFTKATHASLAARSLGENVSMANSIAASHGGLMGSPPHRANILNPKFRVVGIGVAQVAGVVYVTQDFVEPSGAAPRAVAAAKPAAAPKPATAPKPRAPRPAAAPKAPAEAAAPAVAPAADVEPAVEEVAAPEATTSTTDDPGTSFVPTAAMAPPEPGDGAASRVLALGLLVMVSGWATRLRRGATRRA